MRSLIFLYLILCSYSSIGQEWIRVYGQEHYTAYPFEIAETYDLGYIVCSNIQHTSNSYEQINLLKTDINGYKIFEKTIGDAASYHTHNGGFTITPDGGVIISGQLTSVDDSGDPFILKLDACYNIQWCNIYNTPDLYDWAGAIQYMPWDNSYEFVVFNHYYDLADKRLSLFKIDSEGKLIWNNMYATSTDYWNESAVNTIINESDSTLMIYGFVQVYDSIGIPRYQPYWTKINNNGEMEWELFSIPDTSFTAGLAATKPFIMGRGSLLCPVHSFYEHRIRLANISPEGNYLDDTLLYQADTVDDIELTTSERMLDKLIFALHLMSNNQGFYTLQITDTLNNFIRDLKTPGGNIFDIQPTSNNKILISAIHDYYDQDFMLIKYNDSLQYDSVYSNPVNYDTLCPGEITSGTIELACNIITDLKEQAINQVARIKVAPNPADSYTVLYFPDVISVKNNGSSNTESFRSDYVKDLKMTIFDSSSKLMFEDKWPDNTKELVLNTSGWKSGMYFIRVLKNNDLILTGKLIVD